MKIILDQKLLTNPDKILFPGDKITKAELGDYYERIAPYMLPFLKDRPLTMQRFPDGIDHEGWYQKNVQDYFPAWIERIAITNADGSITTYIVAQRAETLVYLAYQAAITFHLWLSKRDKLDYPDRMIFDLDPGEHVTFAMIKKHALNLRTLLEKRGLVSFPMTTGSRGLHIVVPLRRIRTFAYVHEYARQIATEFAATNPQELTVDMRKEKRVGRLFIDFIRNTYGHTAVAPYSVRPLPGAPVATPVTWKEVAGKSLQAQSYTIKNIFERLATVGDVWEDFWSIKNVLKN